MNLTPKSARHSAAVLLRLALYPDEVFRLPPNSRELRVVTGRAWVTHAGQDVVLGRGEAASVAPGRDLAVLSALGRWPLIVEVLGEARPRSSRAT
jgi:hypothetical protein